MAVTKQPSTKGMQAKKNTRSKRKRSKSVSKTRGRRAGVKTHGKRTKSSPENAPGDRRVLAVVENRHYLPSLPVSDDPLEETCLERDPMPKDYVFVPKGDVYITRNCRSNTKDSGRTVYTVYNGKGKWPVGIRVPEGAYQYVLGLAKGTAEARAEAVRVRDERDLKRARKMLQAQFPAMPSDSLETVLQHAFLKGSGRVGRSTRQTDEKKAMLAVEAHIRHTRTPYDSLLDAGLDREEARDAVWDTVKAIKNEWSGNDGSDTISTVKTAKRMRANK